MQFYLNNLKFLLQKYTDLYTIGFKVYRSVYTSKKIQKFIQLLIGEKHANYTND